MALDFDTHNLRALVLRLADGDDWRREDQAAAERACAEASRLGWVRRRGRVELTAQGIDVAGKLRPEPFVVVEIPKPDCFVPGRFLAGWAVKRSSEDDMPSQCTTLLREQAERIAGLLTADHLRTLKVYQSVIAGEAA